MSDTPETDAKVSEHIGFYSCATVPAELCRRLERERDEAREAFIEARKHREQLNSLLQSYEACWDEIKTTLGEPEEGDQTCDLDRVLKAIRERNEARERAFICCMCGKHELREVPEVKGGAK